MPFPLFPLCAARRAEAKAVPEAQGEQGQQPGEGVTQEDFPVLSSSSVLPTTSLSLLFSGEDERARVGGKRNPESLVLVLIRGGQKKPVSLSLRGDFERHKIHSNKPNTLRLDCSDLLVFCPRHTVDWCAVKYEEQSQQQVGADLNVQLLKDDSAFACFIL